MKTDLATAIGAAIIGLIIAFLITSFITGETEDFKYRTVESNISADVGNPNPEVFNYRALNPTVEVFIGSCVEFDENGECITGVYTEGGEELNKETEASQENS